MSWVVFDAEDYWNFTPTPIDEERQLWWSFAHANSERIDEILSTWNKSPAHFCDQQHKNSPLHNAAWHIEKFSEELQQTLVPKLISIGIEVDALNAHGQTVLHMIGARLGKLIARKPNLIGPNIDFTRSVLRHGSQCAVNANGEHPLVEFLAHCTSKNELRKMLDLFADNGADLGVFLNDSAQLNHPRIAQWHEYLNRRAAGEQHQRLAKEIEQVQAPLSKRKM